MREMFAWQGSLVPVIKKGGELSFSEGVDAAIEVVKYITKDQLPESMPNVEIEHHGDEAYLLVKFRWPDSELHVRINSTGNHGISVLSAVQDMGYAGEEWGIMRSLVSSILPKRRRVKHVG